MSVDAWDIGVTPEVEDAPPLGDHVVRWVGVKKGWHGTRNGRVEKLTLSFEYVDKPNAHWIRNFANPPKAGGSGLLGQRAKAIRIARVFNHGQPVKNLKEAKGKVALGRTVVVLGDDGKPYIELSDVWDLDDQRIHFDIAGYRDQYRADKAASADAEPLDTHDDPANW